MAAWVNRPEEFSEEAGMARYIARFMKSVLGENGHESEICQRSVEIEASNKEHAAELAKIKFCESKNVKSGHRRLQCHGTLLDL